MGFLDCSIPISKSTDPMHPAWECCNTLVMSSLLNSLSHSIAQSVIYLDYVVEIWSDLKEHFSRDLLRIAEIEEEVYAFMQGSQSVTDYYTGLKSLWEELDNYHPFLPCTCTAQT